MTFKELKWWTIFVVVILFWLGETWYFGWNTEPGSIQESRLDGIAIGACLTLILYAPRRTMTKPTGEAK